MMQSGALLIFGIGVFHGEPLLAKEHEQISFYMRHVHRRGHTPICNCNPTLRSVSHMVQFFKN